MTDYNFGDIVLIDLPQVGLSQPKKRPALVLIDEGDEDLVLARITSVFRPRKPFDYEIIDLHTAKLPVKSYARVSKIFTVEKKKINKILGTLSDTDNANVKNIIGEMFQILP